MIITLTTISEDLFGVISTKTLYKGDEETIERFNDLKVSVTENSNEYQENTFLTNLIVNRDILLKKQFIYGLYD